MLIAIPSINRWKDQPTLMAMPPEVEVNLFVPEPQVSHYKQKWESAGNVKIHGQPVSINNIGKARHAILEWAYPNNVLMLDDDLAFFKRRTDQPDKFGDSDINDIAAMLADCKRLLDKYAHIAIATREGGNRNTERYAHITRGLRVLGYNSKIVLDEGVEFGRIPVMEDFDVTLQLLRKDYPNCILNWMVHNQTGGSGAAGGCSTYRTLNLQEQAAHKLKELHPDFVTVVQKTTKTAWGGSTRTDVRIQWKKAYDSAIR